MVSENVTIGTPAVHFVVQAAGGDGKNHDRAGARTAPLLMIYPIVKSVTILTWNYIVV